MFSLLHLVVYEITSRTLVVGKVDRMGTRVRKSLQDEIGSWMCGGLTNLLTGLEYFLLKGMSPLWNSTCPPDKSATSVMRYQENSVQ